MRLLVELKGLRDCAYDVKYYHKLQGSLYGLLKDTSYQSLHDERKCKFFCFSNVFPPQDFKRGDVRHFLISSPDEHLLVVFKDKLTQLKRMNVGEMSFSIKGVSLLRPKVTRACTLITGTPIIIRIPRENYDKYGIRPPKDYTYLYWRKNYPFNAFVKQLEDNLIKKYNEFYGVSLSKVPLFEQFIFKKQVCNHIIIKGKEVKVFGSNWEFIFNYLREEQRRIIQFGLDAGFGELNSIGFGFMNLVK